MHPEPHRTAFTPAQASAAGAPRSRRPAPESSAVPPPRPAIGAPLLTASPVARLAGATAAALTPASIVAAVCDAFRVTHGDISSRQRGQHIALARQVAIYLIRELTDYSFLRIGRYFGRDHSTVIHGYARIARRVAAERTFGAMLATLASRASYRDDKQA